jgi:phage FluMu protein Com
MYKKLKCPVCGKRACDISDLPEEKIYIELKCPHCKKLVKIPCVKSAVKTA